VVLPRLALPIIFGLIAAHFNYSYYFSNFGKSSGRTTSHIRLVRSLPTQSWFCDGIRIFGTITMLLQSWFQDLAPLTNNPFWSLSYECVYYALFGIFLYLRGSRRVLGWAILFF
jgi:peptidoglycan/LPS O-acetylase OafA/YrhL